MTNTIDWADNIQNELPEFRCPRMFASDVPAELSGGTPLVIDAGDTFDTAACAGSMKSTSMRSMTARANSSRTRASADGDENRASSSVMTAIAAIFV